jgi:sugar/nucleoside kinase (ribokinase family)
MRVGCLGMATLDTLLFTPVHWLEHDAVTPVEEVVLSAGGKGIVSADAVRRTGLTAVPYALIGASSELPSKLDSFDRRYLIPALADDNRTWITISEAQRVVTFVSHGRLLNGRERAAVEQVDAFLDEIDALYVTVEHPALLRDAIRKATMRQLPVILNPSVPMVERLRREDPALFSELVAQSSTIVCNDWEAPMALRLLGAKAWEEVGESRLEEVVITSGAAGGRFGRRPFERWERFEATPVEQLECVVGAGDTFTGAYLANRLMGGSMLESSRKGADLAALKVGHRGSMLPPEPLEQTA